MLSSFQSTHSLPGPSPADIHNYRTYLAAHEPIAEPEPIPEDTIPPPQPTPEPRPMDAPTPQQSQAQERVDRLNVGGFSDAVFETLSRFASGEGQSDWVTHVNEMEV